MMKHFNIILLIALSMSLAQCSSEEEPYPRPDWSVALEDFVNGNPGWIATKDATVDAPQWIVDFAGNDAAPSWTDPDKSVYPTSMTAVVRLAPALEQFAADADQMAAFIGNECRGVAQPVVTGGVKLFFIQVKAPSNESGKVEFRYYSSHSGRIYKSVADDVAYVINKVYGTADAPAYPNFLQSGKYPCLAKAYVTIAPDALPQKAAQADEIAAIVGNECRSYAYPNADGSYSFDIFGAQEGETLRFKYYSAEGKCTYASEQSFTITANGSIGSADAPVALTFVPNGSMTAFVALNAPLTTYADTAADAVAAFADGTCIGTGEHIGNSVYKLVMNGVVPDGTNIDVKYYSSKLSYVFTAPAIATFANTTTVGSASQPKSLDLNTTGKHPLQMNACFALTGNLTNLGSTSDIMAAFVGDECRGIAQVKTIGNSQTIYVMTINGSLGANERITLKYYSSRAQKLYQASASIQFEGGKQIGTEYAPTAIQFTQQ